MPVPVTPFNPLPQLEYFRPLLMVLAQANLGKKLRRKVDADDIVQEVMQRAYSRWSTCEASDQPEQLKPWLLAIMANVIRDLIKHYARDKRELDKEQSAVLQLEQSAQGIEAFLAAESFRCYRQKPGRFSPHDSSGHGRGDALNSATTSSA